MIEAIVIAVIVAIIVGALLVYLLGPLIKSIPAPVAQIVGDFFVKFGWAIGLLAGLLFFFTHPSGLKL
jgi:hypothetical protein